MDKEFFDQLLGALRRTFATVDGTGLAPKRTVGFPQSATEILDLDLTQYAMYLIASSGAITKRAKNFLDNYFNLGLSLQEIKKMIDDCNIYSEEYETTPPFSLKLMIALDNSLADGNEQYQRAAANQLILLYQILGNVLIADYLDGSDNARREMETYINMLKHICETYSMESETIAVGPKKRTDSEMIVAENKALYRGYRDYTPISDIPQNQQYQMGQKRCPYCYGTNLTTKTKGFSVGQAVAGDILLGPVGVLAGGINANKLRYVCLNCGKEFDITQAL